MNYTQHWISVQILLPPIIVPKFYRNNRVCIIPWFREIAMKMQWTDYHLFPLWQAFSHCWHMFRCLIGCGNLEKCHILKTWIFLWVANFIFMCFAVRYCTIMRRHRGFKTFPFLQQYNHINGVSLPEVHLPPRFGRDCCKSVPVGEIWHY